MHTQPTWLNKLNQLPDEIFSRLSLNEIKPADEKPVRCFLAGLGWEVFLKKLCQHPPWSKTKVFVAAPPPATELDIKKTSEFDFFTLPGNFEEKLTAFPEGTFDLIVLLWNLPANKPQDTIKLVYRSLKKNGQLALVTPWGNSPEIPVAVLKKVLKQNKSLKLKMYKSSLPAEPRQLRKMMEKIRFKDVRAWSDSVPLKYPSPIESGQAPGYIFDDLSGLSGGGLFQKEISEATKFFIRGEFIKLFAALPQSASEEITVNYDFGGATGFK